MSHGAQATPKSPKGRGKSGFRRLFSRGVSLAVAALVAATTLVATFAVMAAFGFLPLSGFEGRISRSIEERLGPSWSVQASSALLQRADGRSAVRIRDVRIQHASGVTVRAPQAVLSYAPWALLRGDVRLTGIDLLGLNLRLGVDAEGGLIFDAGEQPVRLAAPAPIQPSADMAGPQVMVALLAAVDILAREGGELFALEIARLTNARVSLVDAAGKERAALDNVNISMAPVDTATRRIDVSATSPSGPKDFSIELKAVDETARQASIDVRRFQTSDILAMVLGDGWRGLDGLDLAGRVSVSTRGGDPAPLTRLDLAIGPGKIDFPGIVPAQLRIDGGKIALSHDARSGVAEISDIAIRSGVTDFRLAGNASRAPGAPGWTMSLSGGGLVAGEGADPPVKVDRFDARLSGGGDVIANLESLVIAGPNLGASGSGAFKGSLDQPASDARLSIENSDFRAALALWPVFLSAEVRKILSDRVLAARIEKLDLAMDFSPPVMKAALAAEAVPDDAIKITARADGARFLITDGLPVISDAAVTAISTGRTLLLEASSARAQVEAGRALSFSEAAFVIPDTYARRAPARVTFRTTGGVDALASLLASPVLREFAPGQIDPSAIRGSVDLRTAIALPLADDLKPHEVVVVSNGDLRNISSDTLVRNEKLEASSLKLGYERNTLSLKGDGRLGGVAGVIDVRIDQKGVGEASFTAQFDQQARQKRGFALPGLQGPVQVRATKPLARERADQPLKIEADLTRATVDGLLPGWSKPAGRPGKVSFSLVSDPDGPDLNDFLLESGPVLLRGRIELDRQNSFESASFTTARLSPGDDLRVDAATEGGVMRLTVRGKVLDARPLMKFDGKDEPRAPDFDIDLNVPIVTGHNNEVLSNAVVKGQRRQGELRALTVEGRIGRSAVTARVQRGQGAPLLLAEAEDGGAFLRFQDIYRRAYGGNLLVQVPLGDSRAQGNLLYRDFVVRNEPALRRVLAEGQPSGGIGGDRATTVPRMRETGDVAFTKLRSDFVKTGSRFDFRDIVIWGPLLGFTAQGMVDFGRDRVDINGTFVPSYAFNNAFSQVPIFGRILGGGQYEGLFAVNFRLAGSLAQPSMTINPLSAIAPGILRRFVDPGGGGSSLFER